MKGACFAALLVLLAGCQGPDDPPEAGQESPSTGPDAGAYLFVTAFVHLTDHDPAPPNPRGHADCAQSLNVAWRPSGDVWIHELRPESVDVGNLSLLVVLERDMGPCSPALMGTVATPGDNATIDWWPPGSPALEVTRSGDRVHVGGNVSVPNGQDRDVDPRGTGLYDVDFRGENGHRYTGVLYVHNHGPMPRDRLHLEPYVFHACCPPDEPPSGQYWVLKVAGTLQREPHPTRVASCGRAAAPFAGVDQLASRLELPDGTDFSQNATKAVVWDAVEVNGEACRFHWLEGFEGTGFRFHHGLPGGAAVDWDVTLGPNATVDGRRMEPYTTVSIPVDESAAGVRTHGTLNVTVLGPWESGQVRFVAHEGAIVHSAGYWRR